MNVEERDALAMSAEGVPGMLDPDRRDMLHPGEAWQAEVSERAAVERALRARVGLTALFDGLTVDERREILEAVLSG